jgi:hypothetical protein
LIHSRLPAAEVAVSLYLFAQVESESDTYICRSIFTGLLPHFGNRPRYDTRRETPASIALPRKALEKVGAIFE